LLLLLLLLFLFIITRTSNGSGRSRNSGVVVLHDGGKRRISSEGDSMNKVAVRSAVAHSVEVVVRAVRQDAAVGLEGLGAEGHVAGDGVTDLVLVGRGHGEEGTWLEALEGALVGVAPGVVDVDVAGGDVVIEVGVDVGAGGSAGARRLSLGSSIKVGAELNLELLLLLEDTGGGGRLLLGVLLGEQSFLSGPLDDVAAGEDENLVVIAVDLARGEDLDLGVEVGTQSGRSLLGDNVALLVMSLGSVGRRSGDLLLGSCNRRIIRRLLLLHFFCRED